MKKLTTATLLILSLSAQAEGYTYLEFTLGATLKNTRASISTWKGNCPTAFSLGHHWKLRKAVYIRAEIQHLSNICTGEPLFPEPLFPYKEKTQLNQISATVGVQF